MVQTIEKHQKSPLSYTRIFYLVIGIISVRVACEWLLLDFPTQLNIFQNEVRFYLENVYYFLIVFLVSAVLVSKIARISLAGVMNFGVKVYPVIILPPLVDGLLLGRVKGYCYATTSNFLGNLLSLSFLKGDATLGISIEILIALIVIFIYVYLKTKRIWKGIAVFLLIDLLLVIISTPDLFFGKGNSNYHYDYFLPVYYFLPFLLFLALTLVIYNKGKLTAILKNFRPVRALVFCSGVLLGGLMHYVTTGYLYWLNLLLGIFAILLVWKVSVIINDIYDISIDSLTNKTRPLICGVLTVNEYRLTAHILSFLAISCAAVINSKVFLLTVSALVLAFIYSAPPFRLRKNLKGNFVIGISLAISFLIGIYSASGELIILTHRALFLLAFIIILGTVISLAKDIKDIEGDKKAKIKNLFTLYGKKRGKTILIVLIFLTLNIPALALGILTIFLLSLTACYLYYRFESIKGVYIISIAIIFISFIHVIFLLK